jgi:site-specific DNA-methyltransferase (adenine-specific)
MTAPYWTDGQVSLYLGYCREILPGLGVTADCIIADPPYGETSLPWDRWPDGWLDVAAMVTRSLWCFGSLRMYLEHAAEFRAAWKLSQDIIWEKHNGSGIHGDRFRRVHEQATHWYRGPWSSLPIDPAAITVSTGRKAGRITRGSTPHLGTDGAEGTVGDTTLMRSVLRVHSMHGRAIHRTQKPGGILEPMITYACPPSGLVIDPFAGSASALVIARMTGRRGIGIELHEPQAEAAAKWLCQGDLFGGAA